MSSIKAKREPKHLKTLECQKVKFEILCQKYKKVKVGCTNIQHGNHDEIVTKMVFDSNVYKSYTDKNKTNSTISTNSTNRMWVRNISSTQLTEVLVKVLSHGPNFVVVPRCPPVGEYIASIEQACKQLKQGRWRN